MMAEGIYPGGIRKNYLANVYCEMAMESYYNAVNSYEEMKKTNYSWSCSDELSTIRKSIISTTVFSAMTIEAFINNYGATCLEDATFYKKYERGSPQKKFEFIASSILKGTIDQNKPYYLLLDSLFTRRNSYVHSKSECMSEEDLQYLRKVKILSEYESEPPRFSANEYGSEPPRPAAKEIEKIEKDMSEALDALKAIREVAIYFDEHDSNIAAKSTLFGLSGAIFGSSKEQAYKSRVLRELEIKVDIL